jgi:sucrose-6-phosphate hydrolase SacC (GH32 family)
LRYNREARATKASWVRAPGHLSLITFERPRLRVFVDKSVVEVYAGERQAIGRRVYPTRDDSLGVLLFAESGEATFNNVKAWRMVQSQIRDFRLRGEPLRRDMSGGDLLQI